MNNYLGKLITYKRPLFIHGLESLIKEILEEIKSKTKGNFLLFLKKFRVSNRMFYYYKNGKKAISISLFLELLQQYEIITDKKTFEMLDKAFFLFNGISSRANLPVILPKNYTSELAYLTGFILGDGHVSKRLEIVIWEETNQHTKYLTNLIEKLFDYQPTVIKEKNYNIIFISSAPIHAFFSKIIQLPEGKKKFKEKIPEFVFINPEFSINFLRGLFDSDGGVTISKNGKKSILLSSSNNMFLNEISTLLKKFDIHLPLYQSGNRKGFELRSFKHVEIEKFNNTIGFLHPIKQMRANAPVAQSGRATTS